MPSRTNAWDVTRTLTDVFASFDTSIVADALDEHGIDGVVTGIDPVQPARTAVGRAHTLRLREANEAGSQTNFPYAMLRELTKDRVLVLDGGPPDVSCWGGNATRLAANAGVGGVVVDGGFRDVSEIRDVAVPVFGRSRTPKTGQRRLTVDRVGEPVEIGDVTVAPNDLVVADATGIVVVPDDAVAAVADTAETLLGEELLISEKIASGATVEDLERDDHEF